MKPAVPSTCQGYSTHWAEWAALQGRTLWLGRRASVTVGNQAQHTVRLVTGTRRRRYTGDGRGEPAGRQASETDQERVGFQGRESKPRKEVDEGMPAALGRKQGRWTSYAGASH